jgi:hypothetical protein
MAAAARASFCAEVRAQVQEDPFQEQLAWLTPANSAYGAGFSLPKSLLQLLFRTSGMQLESYQHALQAELLPKATMQDMMTAEVWRSLYCFMMIVLSYCSIYFNFFVTILK